jgi:lipopolysaccharide transport system permease protein
MLERSSITLSASCSIRTNANGFPTPLTRSTAALSIWAEQFPRCGLPHELSMAVAPVRTLRPSSGWAALELGELFQFKDLLMELARRDVKLRYRQTLLGVAWVLIQPLVAAGMLTFAFGIVAGLRPEGTSAYLFTYAGLLVWNAFAWTLNKTSFSMIGNVYLVSKVYFPRLVLPLSGVMSTLVDLGISLAVLLVGLAVFQVWPGTPLLLIPLWIALVLCLALGAGLIAAALTVEYRDIQHILPIVIPFLLYASPVAYEVTRIPMRYRSAFYLVNPLAGLLEAFRWSALGRPLPPVWTIVWSAVFAIALFAFGAALFRRIERKFADVI